MLAYVDVTGTCAFVTVVSAVDGFSEATPVVTSERVETEVVPWTVVASVICFVEDSSSTVGLTTEVDVADLVVRGEEVVSPMVIGMEGAVLVVRYVSVITLAP